MPKSTNISTPADSIAFEPLMTQSECSAAVKLSESRLEKARVHGDGPPFVKLGRSVRYRPSDVKAWLADRVRNSTSEAA